MIPISEMRKTDEVFTWVCETTGKNVSYAITHFREWPSTARAPVTIGIYPPNFDKWLLEHRAVDLARVAQLTDENLEDPTILVNIDAQSLLIDGAHRCYARIQKGHRGGPTYLVPPLVAEYFEIDLGFGARTMSAEEVLALPTHNIPHRKVTK